MTNESQNVIAGLGLFILGFIAGFGTKAATAHDCYETYEIPEVKCRYIGVVHPISGELVQEYVCK